MLYLRRFGILAVCALATLGCRDTTPARLVVPNDTLVINSTDWMPLGARVLNRHGEPLARATLSYSTVGTPRLEVADDGSLNCQDDGAGLIVVRVDSLRAERPVRCHLARRFAGSYGRYLTAGGPPVPFTIQAIDAQGHIIPEPHLHLIVGDTTVIALRDGMVFGLKRGVASIRVRSSGQEGGQVYFVEDSAVTSTKAASDTRAGPVPR